MTPAQLLKSAKYSRVKCGYDAYEFRFKVFPHLNESGIAVGYGKTVKEARETMVNDSSFIQWAESR